MNAKHWMMVAMGLLVISGSTGCRGRFGRRAGSDLPPGHIDPTWPGSIDILDEDVLLGERFGYSEVLDVQFENVLFGFDSSQVAPGEQAKVEAVADFMRRNPAVKLIVEGHTCDVGTREYNMSLGERRALAARAYLVQSAIDPARIQTRSFGKEKLLHIGEHESARRLNRRAEFVLVR